MVMGDRGLGTAVRETDPLFCCLAYRVEADSIITAELEATPGAQAFVQNLLQDRVCCQHFFENWRPQSYIL